MSLRDTIINSDDINSEVMEIPRWGVSVLVKGMSGAERADFMTTFADPESGQMNYGAMYPSIIIKCVLDPDTGIPVFTQDDLGIINTKAGDILEKVAQKAMKLSGMGEDEVAAAAATFPEQS